MWVPRFFSAPRVDLRRRLLMLATPLLVACFTLVSPLAPIAAAINVNWDGSALIAGGEEYSYQGQIDDNDPRVEANSSLEGRHYYERTETVDGQTLTHVIYFDTHPPAAGDRGDYLVYEEGSDNPLTTDVATATTLVDAQQPDEDSTASSNSTCSNGGLGLGWLLCPTVRFLSGSVDWVYDKLVDFLEVPATPRDPESGVYSLWSILRTIANVLFVIVFMVIIYSQITGLGISNHSIKAMLPRLIIGAILVNVSFWVSVIGIEISNVLGHSVYAIFDNIEQQISTDFTGTLTWDQAATQILNPAAGAAAVGALIFTGADLPGIFFLLLAGAAAVAFAVFVALAILAARQALLTLLVILSPLAMVAFVLPSTESWFDRWRKTFITLLMFFPLFGMLFGASTLAGKTIINAADGRVHIVIFGLVMMGAPLVLTPLLVRFSTGILGQIANLTNNKSRGPFDRLRNWSSDAAKYRFDKAAAGETSAISSLGMSRGLGLANANRRFRNNAEHRKNRQESYRKSISNQGKYRRNAETGEYEEAREGWRRTDELARRQSLDEEEIGNLDSRRWERSSYYDSSINAQRHRVHSTHKDAETLKKAIDSAGDRHYNEHLKTPAGAEIRGIRMRGAVDAGLAENDEKELASQDSRKLQETISASRGLRQTVVRTTENTNRAKTLENTVQKGADANWSRLATTDNEVKSMLLNEEAASESHKLAAAQWDQIIENVREKGVDAEGLSTQTDVRAAGNIKAYNTLTVAANQSTEDIKAVSQSRAKITHLESDEGQRLNRRAKAAQGSLEAVQNEEEGTVQEWRTEAGAANLTGADVEIARELRESDIKKRAQVRRTTAGSDQASEEYAKKVLANVTIPGGTETIAEVAGGVTGQPGQNQAKATAFQTVVDISNKAVAAEKTLVSRVDNDDILGTTVNDAPGLGSADILSEPAERISALAGTIAKRQHMASHIKLWYRMGELKRQTEAELKAAQQGDDQAAIEEALEKISKIKDVEQQVMADKSKVPFGVGDGDLGAADTGDYAGNVYKSTRSRIQTHMSAKRLASMDPDDMRVLYELAANGKLSQAQLDKIKDAYHKWKKDPMLRSSFEEKHAKHLDAIVEHAETGSAVYDDESKLIHKDIRLLSDPSDA